MSGKKLSLLFLSAALAAVLAAAGAEPARAGAYPESPAWDANWIWCAGCDASPRNFYMYARRTFVLPAEATSAAARVTADSRYSLYVNGELVGQGPVKSDRRWLYYDEWDIKKYLKPGANVVAALVHHYGEWTFSYMLGRGGLILEADVKTTGGNIKVLTDRNWKAQPADAWWRDLNRMSIQQGFPEVFDARKALQGWNDAGFDDSSWADAVELGRPPVEPWQRLIPRRTPDYYETIVRPAALTAMGDVKPGAIYEGIDFGRVYPGAGVASAYAFTWMYVAKPMTVPLELSSLGACKLWMGKSMIMTNYYGPEVHIDTTAKPLDLSASWTPLLVKCVDLRDGWNFILTVRLIGHGGIIFSPYKDPERQGWSVVGPFHSSDDPDAEFKKSYPPQKKPDISEKYESASGAALGWSFVDNTDRMPARLGYALADMKTAPLEKSVIVNAQSLFDPEGRGPATTVRTGADGAAYMLLDFGREVNGYPRITVESESGGEVVDLGYVEALEDDRNMAVSPLRPEGGRANTVRGGVNYADRYFASAGSQTFETFSKRAFRYMLVVVRGAEKPLALKFAGLRFSTYDVGARGRFESSDDTLNRIWNVGAYTVQMNMDDSFTDCPWRERGEWWGDARIEILINYYAFGDAALARRGILQIGESQREDGLVAGIYPTDWDNRWLPDYALIWIMSAWDYYMFTGDDSLLPELLPRIKKLLDGFFLGHEKENHLLTDVPHWVFIDWAPVEKRGAITALNAFYYQALRDAAAMFRAAGDAESAAEYDGRAELVKKAMNEFLWDSARGVYADCFAEGALCKTISQQANSLAVLFDIAPREKQRAVMYYVMDPDRDVVRAGSPYFSFYILNALRHVDADAAAMDYVMRWKEMLDWGATTWWEVWNTSSSHCHGWSAAPTYDLSRYVLGVSPLAPGFSRALIEPHPGKLESVSGVVPTPRGDIPVRWEYREVPRRLRLVVTLPEKITGEAWLPIRMKNWKMEINGSEKLPAGARRLGFDGRVGLELPGGGTYDIVITGI